MGTSKTNISKINKYIKGRLNAHDMHQLERETYDDAFLNEAMEGYEELASDDHEETLADLKMHLHKRATKEKKSVFIMWRLLPIAASVLVLLGAAYWFFKPEAVQQQFTKAKQKDSKKEIVVNKPAPQKITLKEGKLIAEASVEPIPIKEPESVLREVVIAGNPSIKYKTDTVEYIASAYKVRVNASANEMLKKAEGFEVDTNGSITHNGQPVTKARLNGKDYSGGDVAQAVKSLPADIVEKFQIVDDYGDQAGKTGIRSGEPDKVLRFEIRNKNATSSTNGFNEPLVFMPQLIYKEDTAEYITNNYPINNAAKVLHVINRLSGFERNVNGLLFEGKPVKKISVNSVEDKGKDMLGITLRLPADVLEKVQIIDDYSDMAKRSFRSQEPEKVINLVVRDIKNRRLPWSFYLKGVTVPGDTVSTPKPAMGWKKYADYVRKNVGAATKKSDELMVFFYVDADGGLSNIRVIGYSSGAQYEKAVAIIKDGPAWVGYKEPRQVWLKFKLTKK